MEKDKIAEVWNRPKGTKYRYKTTDYYLCDKGSGVCSIHIQESKGINKEPMDWIRNFDIRLSKTYIKGKKVYVHKGFKEARNELMWDLHPRLRDFHTIELSGYSHGAGIAQLLYFYLKANTEYKAQPPVLFGCPNVISWLSISGYKEVRDICSDITRVRIGNDIVGKVPSWWMGYRSVGSEVHLKVDRPKQNIKEYIKSLFMDHGLYYKYFK